MQVVRTTHWIDTWFCRGAIDIFGTDRPKFLVALFLFVSAFLSESAQGQNNPAGPDPIGKVVTAKGSVLIEHAGAVVVQASMVGSSSPTNVGDLVYKGDLLQTGTDGKVGIVFLDGSAFNLSNNAQIVLNEFVYD